MISKITISPDLDLVAIAETAGQSDPEARWYDDGVLYVRGVTDEALARAAQTIASPAAQAARLTASRLADLAAVRWQHQNAGVVVDGVPLRTDRESMADLRLIADRAAGDFPLSYKAESGFVTLASKEQATRYADAQKAHVQACFEREAVLAERITACQGDAEKLAALDLEDGWPR